MRRYEIDFQDCKTYWQLYEAIIKGMQFPDWCGKNPDAIWDFMTSNIDTPAVVYLKEFDNLPQNLKEEKMLLLNIFEEAVKWYKDLGEYIEIK